MSWSGTVRCGYCYEEGHNKRSCPQLKKRMEERLAANPDDWYAKEYHRKKKQGTKRRCTYCNLKGHNRRTCPHLAEAKAEWRAKTKAWRQQFAEWCADIGLTVGSLVKVNTGYGCYGVRMVTGFVWSACNPEVQDGNYSHQVIALRRLDDPTGTKHGTRHSKLPNHPELVPGSSAYVEMVGPVATTAESLMALAPDWFADASEDLSDVFDKDRKHKDFYDNQWAE